MPDAFDSLSGGDGYLIEKVRIGDRLSLHVGIYEGWQLVPSLDADNHLRLGEQAAPKLFEWYEPDPRQEGECDRLHCFLEAAARFLNTGGSKEQLHEAIRRLDAFATGGAAFPGYTFRYSNVGPQGCWEHIFLADDADERRARGEPELVVWTEGSGVERLTLAQYEESRFGPTDLPDESDE